MKTHRGVLSLLGAAEREHRCAAPRKESLRRACHRRLRAGELVSPYPGLYADNGYWRNLNTEERSLHVIRGLAMKHPRWVFAGLSAACLHGFQHAYALHDGTVFIASRGAITGKDHSSLRRIYMNDIPTWTYQRAISMTSPARTLIDCASHPFPNALAIYDSALRMRVVDTNEIRALMLRANCDETAVARLLRYADPQSENGGESLMRGVVIDLNFAIPQLQVEFDNPGNPSMPYRVDFCWRLADGRVIVAEYDGMAKYADTGNPNRASLQAKLDHSRMRDRHLTEQGVTSLIHVFYEDVVNPRRLENKLGTAGVPRLQ